MASFTAFDLPTDKEDIFWDDSITKGSTDFFDQFVVLDDCNTDWTNAGDFAFSSLGKDAATQDILPPTSIGPLSVSSNASVDLTCTATSSSHSHTGPIGTPGNVHQQPYHPTLNVAHEASHPEIVEQRHLHMSSRRVPVGASISDAELLKLEGLSMRSPIRAARPPIPETFLPPSPPLQSATTVRPQATDAKKRSRLESIYATIRKAAHIRTRPRVDQQSVPIPQTVVPANLSPKKTHRRLKSENMTATQARNFPLSPPMSNPMPDLPQQSHGESGFVTGFLDDPFFEPNGHLAPPAQINGATVPNTPLDTPQMEGHNRHAVGIVPTSLALDQSHGLPLSNWPLATTTMAEVTSMDWPSTTYVTASAVDDQWWEGPGAHDIDMAGAHDFQANAKNASLNLNLQLQPQEFHNSGMEDFANGGLMIHMPQPRTPNAAPLLAKDVAMNERPPLPPPPPADHAPPMPSPTRGYHTEHRRPKPRAPSTGARHGLALTSPRKRQSSQSSSRSTSPTPGAGAGRMKRSSSLQPVCPSFGQPSATGAAVRKRKSAASISKRNYTPHSGGGGFAEPRTPNPQGNGGGCDIGFVNFTPSDHNILMTGVAPSGSSKTKARREKEAAEKQRKMSEAFLKAVKAAGADVTKLKEEGIVM